MALSFPKAVAIVSLAFEPETNEAVISFRSENGSTYQLRLDPALVPGVALGLFGLGSALASQDGKPYAGQVVTATGSRKALGPQGQPILDFELEGGFRLPVMFPVEALEILKNDLTQLQQMTLAHPKSTGAKLH